MEYNGGSVVAMIGKDCVAIASDLRLGQQQVGVASNFDKVSLLGSQGSQADQLGLPRQR
jgi:20S proteasome alpha/beta subunit